MVGFSPVRGYACSSIQILRRLYTVSELDMTHYFWEDPPDIIAAYLYGSERMFGPWKAHASYLTRPEGTNSDDCNFFDYEHCMRILKSLMGNPGV